jgi:hypothetical protein
MPKEVPVNNNEDHAEAPAPSGELERHWQELLTAAAQKGVDIDKFRSLPRSKQWELKAQWEWEEREPDAYKEKQALEQRLHSLTGKKVEGCEVGTHGGVTIRFEDGTILEFVSQDLRDYEDLAADFEGVTVSLPEGKH